MSFSLKKNKVPLKTDQFCKKLNSIAAKTLLKSLFLRVYICIFKTPQTIFSTGGNVSLSHWHIQ